MANDRHVIQYMSPAELVGLMNATGVTVQDTITSDGKPVIHAALKVVNAETGEQLPGGLPFSVVMFKSPNEAGYSNIAIGTIVPASELNVRLPRDYFNFCNQRFRFCRVFPVDERSFVIQMDLVLKNATREYVKFAFGLWGALFSQMVFELMGRGRESLVAAAEAYAQAHTDFAQQIAAAPAIVEPVAGTVAAPEVAVAEPEEEPLPLEADAIVPPEGEAAVVDDAAPADVVAAEVPAEEAPVAMEPVVADAVAPVEIVEMPDAAVEATDLELSIVAGPAAEVAQLQDAPEIAVSDPVPTEEAVVLERDEVKELEPA